MVLRELVPGDIIYGTDFFGIDDLYKKKIKILICACLTLETSKSELMIGKKAKKSI